MAQRYNQALSQQDDLVAGQLLLPTDCTEPVNATWEIATRGPSTCPAHPRHLRQAASSGSCNAL